MTLDITRGAVFTATSEGKQFLVVTSRNGFVRKLKYYRENQLILETSTFYLFWIKKIRVKYQSLPIPIEYIKPAGLTNCRLKYGNEELLIKGNILKNPVFTLFRGGGFFGEIRSTKLISFGEIPYQMRTESDHEQLNLYFLLLFIAQSLPL